MEEHYDPINKDKLKKTTSEHHNADFVCRNSSMKEHDKNMTAMKFKKSFGKDFPAEINLDLETVKTFYNTEELVRVDGLEIAVDICKQNMRGLDPFTPLYIILAIFQIILPWIMS